MRYSSCLAYSWLIRYVFRWMSRGINLNSAHWRLYTLIWCRDVYTSTFWCFGQFSSISVRTTLFGLSRATRILATIYILNSIFVSIMRLRAFFPDGISPRSSLCPLVVALKSISMSKIGGTQWNPCVFFKFPRRLYSRITLKGSSWGF